VASSSRLLEITGLFCKRALQKRPIFSTETYNFKEPTTRSHPILRSIRLKTELDLFFSTTTVILRLLTRNTELDLSLIWSLAVRYRDSSTCNEISLQVNAPVPKDRMRMRPEHTHWKIPGSRHVTFEKMEVHIKHGNFLLCTASRLWPGVRRWCCDPSWKYTSITVVEMFATSESIHFR